MAFTVIRLGSETRVNSIEQETPGQYYQGMPSITTLSDGRWVVAWDGFGPEGRGVYQQVYSGNGTPVFTQEQRVNIELGAGAADRYASVEALDDGGWLVTWTRNTPGSDENVFVQRFNADGVPLLSRNGVPADIQVNQSTIGTQKNSKVAVLEDGGWLVTWADSVNKGVYQQRYDADGIAQGTNRRINTSTGADISDQDVAAIDGGAVVVWVHQMNAATQPQLIMQILDVNGDPILRNGSNQIADRVIGSASTADQIPRVVASPDGDGFLVVWAGADPDGSSGILLQKFDNQGNAAFNEPLRVNTIVAGKQYQPSVEFLEDGGWIVTYSAVELFDVYQRRYDKNGNPQGAETPIAAWLGSQWNRESDVSYLGGGKWVAAWSNWNQLGDRQSGVAQRVFTTAEAAILTSGDEVATGVAGAETLQVQAGGLSSGDRVDGGDGDDTLEMIEAGTLDLRAPLELRGFEIITGTGEEDKIIANVARLSGIETINGGGGSDTLELAGGGTFDLSNIVLDGIESIVLTEASATVKVDDVATALLIRGDSFEEDRVELSGGGTLQGAALSTVPAGHRDYQR